METIESPPWLREVRSGLIHLAAEMAQGKTLPSCFEDGNFYASTPVSERRRILKAIDDMGDSLRLYAIRIRDLADKIPGAIRTHSATEDK